MYSNWAFRLKKQESRKSDGEKVGKPETKFLRECKRIRLGAGREIRRGSKKFLILERGDDREDTDALKKRPMAASGRS